MALKCSRGHRMEVYDEEYPGCLVCHMEAGTAGPHRRDYDGRRLADNEHETQCPVYHYGKTVACQCERPPTA